jgi:hypothetical protein
LLKDRDESSNIHRDPSTDASYQVSVQLAKQGRNRPKIACDGHVFQWIETKSAIFIENLPLMPPTKFQFICESGVRGYTFIEINQ